MVSLNEKKRAREIKSKLMMAGVSQTSLAKKLRVTRVAVSGVINGHWRSRRIEGEIANVLSMRVEDLWPELSKRKAA